MPAFFLLPDFSSFFFFLLGFFEDEEDESLEPPLPACPLLT
jgi:hypothetical protein